MTTPTTTESIADLIERRTALLEAYRDIKDALNETDFQIIATMREKYPDEYARWERGIQSFKAEGVEFPVSRSYDNDKLRAEFGETMPELFETVTPEPYVKADGRKLAQMWKQADLARRLEGCLLPPAAPKLKVSE